MSELITIKKDDKEIEVTERAFDVVYSQHGYVRADGGKKQMEDVDLFTLSEDELKKVNKDEIRAFLDKEGIEYDPKAAKDELMKIVLGDNPDEQPK